jgi:hypothetical protein
MIIRYQFSNLKKAIILTGIKQKYDSLTNLFFLTQIVLCSFEFWPPSISGLGSGNLFATRMNTNPVMPRSRSLYVEWP